MDAIVGRNSEIKELNDAFESKKAELIVVYGRRRVGKTYLITRFFQKKKCTYFQMTGIYKGPLRIQLDRFSKEIGQTFYNGAPIQSPKNWMEAFELLKIALEVVPKNKKIVIFLDELPWLSTKKSGVISTIEYFWNRYFSNDNRIKFIACGSAASWIIKKIIKDRGGLHNRITRKIRLLPFNLHETSLYLNHLGYQCTQEQTLKLYMTMGGVPFYLNQIKNNLSVDHNIDDLFFNSEGILFDEFDELFKSLFDNSAQYKELVVLIGAAKEGLSRSMLNEKSKLTKNGGQLTNILTDLENVGFITSYIPFGHKKLGIYFRISDEYFYFYLKWIDPVKNQLKQNNVKKYWRSIVGTPEYFGWIGYVFENICYKHSSQIKEFLDIEANSLAFPWRYSPQKNTVDRGAQIDLLFDRKDSIVVCEIKCTNKPFSVDKEYSEKLKQKIETFLKVTRTKKKILLTMISSAGMSKTKYSNDLIGNLVTLSVLFE